MRRGERAWSGADESTFVWEYMHISKQMGASMSGLHEVTGVKSQENPSSPWYHDCLTFTLQNVNVGQHGGVKCSGFNHNYHVVKKKAAMKCGLGLLNFQYHKKKHFPRLGLIYILSYNNYNN